jgi:alpha-L-fucosidase 2
VNTPRRIFCTAYCCLVAVVSLRAGTNDLTLWYPQPAQKWTEALPIGNGYMGAMVFGGTTSERIQFNEDTLWRGKPHDYVRNGALEVLPEIRRLVFEGKADEAAKLAKEKAISDPVRQLPYQPFGDLRLTFPGHENVTDYRRDLDLDSAVASVRYKVGDVTFRREAFASYPDRVIVLRLTADKPGQVSFTLRMDSPHTNSQVEMGVPASSGSTGKKAPRVSVGVGVGVGSFGSGGGVGVGVSSSRDVKTEAEELPWLKLTGRVQVDGLRFESRALVRPESGTVVAADSGLRIEQADAVTVLLVAATSFKNFQDISADPARRCREYLAELSRRNYDTLRAAHIADHQKLFRRVNLDLGHTIQADLPTDERQRQLKASPLENDPALAALHFQYGRYLLIASSRPGSQPANLQGVWNEELNPPWESKYTLNINAEMNYWPAELCNLSETHEPLFDLIDDLTISGARAAKQQYGAKGWVVHHNTDLWRGAAPINNVDGFWPTGGAWLCHHLWEHYLFTGDKKFLKQRAYPVMKSASLFFVDFLIKDPKTGYLVTSPSHSPEQTPPNRPLFSVGPTMDNQLIRALFTYTIEAAEILGTDKKFAKQLIDLRAQLPPNMVGKHGQLQEWIEDWDAPNNNHRHMSPLFALYPGWEINPGDPKIYDAAKLLLKWRGDGSTGWSYAWRMPLWARVGDGAFAFRQFQGILQKRTLPNLFDLCGPFQIDGNFGACAGVAEMLVHSHLTEVGSQKSEIRILDLLPALPKAWPTGSVKGLCARGGFEVDIEWKDGALTQATIRSKLGNVCKVKCGLREVELKTKSGGVYALNQELLLNAK